MKALVLERKGELSLRDIDVPLTLGPQDVRILVHTVGICGSDVHFYKHGGAGNKIVRDPMILGHEASGTIVEVGADVTELSVGDRVCMEPGIPDFQSKASRSGTYNLDPQVRFWATPPVHGCLTPMVVHPSSLTYHIPDNLSYAEGALIEPFAVGLHAATKAKIRPGDIAVVIGAGTIGIMVALSALAGGCSKVIISDIHDIKLSVAASYKGVVPVNVTTRDLESEVLQFTNGWGADIVFEASGNNRAFEGIVDLIAPGGRIILVGLPQDPVAIGLRAAINKEVSIETVYRYVNVFPKAIQLVSAGRVELKRLVSATFPFKDSVQAFDRAVEGRAGDVKIQIEMGESS
ncbi:NAD(P)-dependent alcohol dehydrogenase [Rhizobium sp. NLR17b]|uniref:NAD(P)-dependent alcohol dehydrogenase n=1 Tax=Rhizobium sp. NLR17b TaxID=2731114 RepID=UPI001C82A93D|nr:NAD(P)-dependent alcohol dehydrogenase [Rhizobium sp. NLR17b]MBX5272669.1 NAD(P)-dependent alcohol dehydrogenase [Rhizobium sp. NLR17b]